jgi:hypothetical protein
LPAEAQVVIRSVPEGAHPDQSGVGKNISGGGILLSSQERFKPGTVLDIEVMTPTHRSFIHVFKPLMARVRVVRVEGDEAPFDIAAEFITVER